MVRHSIASLEGKLILFATILASGMAFLDGSVVNIAVPTIQETMNASLTGIQWVINGYTLMLCALILISGALGDRYGRKRIFLYGIFLFILASFLCSIAHSVEQLALFRMIQGVGGAMMVPGSLSIINAAFEEGVRGRVIGMWSGFAGGVAALGPFLGGWLVQTFGWSAIFYINIPLGLVALLLTVRYVPETKNAQSTHVDFLGSITIFLSLFALAYGLISGPDEGWKSPLILASLVGGVVLFIAFIFLQMRLKQPLIPLSIFRSPLVVGANLVTLFLYFALSGVIFFLVLNMQQIQHFPPVYAGLGMLPSVLLITFLSGPAGALADKIGPRTPMIVGPLIVSVGMTWLAVSGSHANYFINYLPGLVLFGAGMALVIAPLTKSALAVEERYSGAASGVNNAVARVAGLLAVALLGAIMLSIFENQLHNRMLNTFLNESEKTAIISQQSKLSGIAIPQTFSEAARNEAEQIIEESFIYSFHWGMGINAALAFLGAVISYFTIRNKRAISR